MVTAFDQDVGVLFRVSPGQAKRRHDGFRSRVRETHELRSGHHLLYALGDRGLTLGSQCEDAAHLHPLARGLIHPGIGVAQDRRAVAEPVVDVLVVVDVPKPRALASVDVDGSFIAPVAKVRRDAERQAPPRSLEVPVGPLE